jgi:hypothetical protein
MRNLLTERPSRSRESAARRTGNIDQAFRGCAADGRPQRSFNLSNRSSLRSSRKLFAVKDQPAIDAGTMVALVSR